MSEFYEKLSKVAKEKPYHEKRKVLEQLLILAFFNDETGPGELPEIFTLTSVKLFSDEVERLLESVGFKANVEKTRTKFDQSGFIGFDYFVKKAQCD